MRESGDGVRVSVVVPTFDEAPHLRRTLESARTGDRVELVVVDGGSSDGTVDIARECADLVLEAPRGRALQLNAGAAAATGDVLLFLHADTVLAPGSLAALRRALRSSVGGAFAVQVESMPWISWTINLRSRLLSLPYGDQGLFVRRALFEELGGFRPLEIMEDVDLVRRMRRHGRLALVRPPVQTSARRWRANGVLRTTLVNLTAAAMGALSVPPRRIRRFYDAHLVSGRGPERG